LTDRNNDELAIERKMLPMIVMWMSPGNETGTGDAFTVPRWIGELRLVPTNINRVLVVRYTGSGYPFGIFKLFLLIPEEIEDTKGVIRI
jgi:hypothetical protein